MIFAVAMTFIDQTIVSIAVPNIQRELGLTSTGIQWVVNGYLLSLAALFAFGGRLGDTLGHRKMVIIGVVVFAGASAMCGFTPKGSYAEAWLVGFRILQGAGGAIMYPAALAIVVNTFALRERGKALAVFFGIAGGLTAVGPILGGYLTQWTWRAIFWVNLPVAAIALVLIVVSKPTSTHKPSPIDWRGAGIIAAGVALSVFGFQQSSVWGWQNPGIGLCIGGGLALLLVFYLMEVRTASPLMNMKIFANRPFLVENLVLFVTMFVFIPVFFFGSEYAQISLGKSSSNAGIVLLYFFIGFVIAAQIGGRMLDRVGAKRPVVIGCLIGAIGFYLWGHSSTHLTFGAQQLPIIVSGFGMGLMLGQSNTDAVNRASRYSYGEATGITQTARNYAASLGLAILGTILVTQMRSQLTTHFLSLGMARAQATSLAAKLAQGLNGSSVGGASGPIPAFFRHEFASAIQVVLYVMAGVMALAAVIAMRGLQPGRQEDPSTSPDAPETGADATTVAS